MSTRTEKNIAVTLVAIMVLLQLVNVVRVIANPIGFSEYMGLPLSGEAPVGFVYVYALRTLFIAVLAGLLLIQRQFRILFFVAALAVLMPIGDAVLAHGEDAPISVVARHVTIALYLIGTAVLLRRVDISAKHAN